MAKARSLNRVQLIGNLTRDPLIRESSNGVLVCTFGIATNVSWRDSEGNTQERAEFHNIVAFNKLAEICAQVLAKGMLVFVEGELRSRRKENNEGFKYDKVEVKLNDMLLLNDKDKEPVGIEAAREAGNNITEYQQPTGDSKESSSGDGKDEDFDENELF